MNLFFRTYPYSYPFFGPLPVRRDRSMRAARLIFCCHIREINGRIENFHQSAERKRPDSMNAYERLGTLSMCRNENAGGLQPPGVGFEA